jgi:hypothetical protein
MLELKLRRFSASANLSFLRLSRAFLVMGPFPLVFCSCACSSAWDLLTLTTLGTCCFFSAPAVDDDSQSTICSADGYNHIFYKAVDEPFTSKIFHHLDPQ